MTLTELHHCCHAPKKGHSSKSYTMILSSAVLSFAILIPSVATNQWPYNRVAHGVDDYGKTVAVKSDAVSQAHPENLFVGWLRGIVNKQNLTAIQHAFVNGTISDDVQWFDDVSNSIDTPDCSTLTSVSPHPILPNFPLHEATHLFSHLGYPLDPRCTVDRSRWYYRTDDGSCNWLQKGEYSIGATGTAKARDYDQHFYADGISKPRAGPNARAVSNAFFRRKKEIYYEHTPLLLGLIEVSCKIIILDAPLNAENHAVRHARCHIQSRLHNRVH